MRPLDQLPPGALLTLARDQQEALKTLLRVESGRVRRLTTANPDLQSKAENEQARAWADAAELVKS